MTTKKTLSGPLSPITRRELLWSAAAAGVVAALGPISNLAAGASESTAEYSAMPSNEEMFKWIETLWEFGDRDKYRYRMPGTRGDHQATEFLEKKFKECGLRDVRRELVPIPVMFPDRWTVTVKTAGKSEEIPCWFMPYAAPTPLEGLTGKVVYVGKGSEQDFKANAGRIAGNIVLVDMYADGHPMNKGKVQVRAPFDTVSYYMYDPKHTLEGDMYSDTNPVKNHMSTIALARRFGAIGYIGILTYRADDVCQQYHGEKPSNQVMTCLTVSPSGGRRIKELLAGGPLEATLLLTEDTGTPFNPALSATCEVKGPDGDQLTVSSTWYGTWGHTYNIYGVLPGTTDETLLVLSHHDGGAVNEASGPAVVLALAKYFAQTPKPARRKTLMFALFGSHYGLRPPLLMQAHGIAEVKDKIECALSIEMIGRQYKLRDGKYVSTGLASPTMFGVKDGNPKLVGFVRDAIEKHNLDRSFITNILLGEAGVLGTQGGVPNVIEHSSINAPQFSLADTPETVDKEALRPTACAFADIIKRLDSTPAGK